MSVMDKLSTDASVIIKGDNDESLGIVAFSNHRLVNVRLFAPLNFDRVPG